MSNRRSMHRGPRGRFEELEPRCLRAADLVVPTVDDLGVTFGGGPIKPGELPWDVVFEPPVEFENSPGSTRPPASQPPQPPPAPGYAPSREAWFEAGVLTIDVADVSSLTLRFVDPSGHALSYAAGTGPVAVDGVKTIVISGTALRSLTVLGSPLDDDMLVESKWNYRDLIPRLDFKGVEQIHFGAVTIVEQDVLADLTIDAGEGNDEIAVDSVTGSSDNDRAVTLRGGAGNNDVALWKLTAGSLTADAGSHGQIFLAGQNCGVITTGFQDYQSDVVGDSHRYSFSGDRITFEKRVHGGLLDFHGAVSFLGDVGGTDTTWIRAIDGSVFIGGDSFDADGAFFVPVTIARDLTLSRSHFTSFDDGLRAANGVSATLTITGVVRIFEQGTAEWWTVSANRSTPDAPRNYWREDDIPAELLGTLPGITLRIQPFHRSTDSAPVVVDSPSANVESPKAVDESTRTLVESVTTSVAQATLLDNVIHEIVEVGINEPMVLGLRLRREELLTLIQQQARALYLQATEARTTILAGPPALPTAVAVTDASEAPRFVDNDRPIHAALAATDAWLTRLENKRGHHWENKRGHH